MNGRFWPCSLTSMGTYG